MDLINLITKLISFKTVTGNHNEVLKCYEFIKNYLGDNFYFKDITYNDYNSLIISNKNDFENFDILFNGHIDVVTADDKDFEVKIDGDKLYGRGSIDMKSQIATILHILKNVKTNKHLGLILTSDEEIGGHNGSEYIVNNLKINTKLLIVPDAGENFSFVDSEKALLQLDLASTGISAHASTPNLGKNAILSAINVYTELCKTFNLETSSPVNDNISINLSKMQSGDVYNKVPELAAWAMDIRFNRIKKQDILDNLKTICDKNNTVFSIHDYADEFICDLNNSEVKKFIDICEKYLNQKIEHIIVNGASDIHYYSQKGIPSVSINPEGYNLHSKNEYIILSSLTKFEEMLIDYINS